jgi:hypothetical protein
MADLLASAHHRERDAGDEMSVSLIAVGIDPWEASTLTLVETVRKHEPSAELMIVDNLAETPYPKRAGALITRTRERLCMSSAMNHGARFFQKMAPRDWYVFMNNDLTCTGPFLHLFDNLRDDTVYGNDMLVNWWNSGRSWLDGWIMAIPRQVWEAVGTFDPAFTYAGFEDADYCFRCEENGFKVEAYPFPFVHRELHSRFSMPGYMAQRESNIAYLCDKWGIRR